MKQPSKPSSSAAPQSEPEVADLPQLPAGAAMEWVYNPNEKHQLTAIRSVLELFTDLPTLDLSNQQHRAKSKRGNLIGGVGPSGKPNIDAGLHNSNGQLLANLQNIQRQNSISNNEEGEPDESFSLFMFKQGDKKDTNVTTMQGTPPPWFPNFTIEMETATGKTYTYLRTCLELAKERKFRKFIIVIPSLAIREGIISSFKAMERHFKEELFPDLDFELSTYDATTSKGGMPQAVTDFLDETEVVKFLLVSRQALTKQDGVLNREFNDNESAVKQLQKTRPILVLDEPQNMESNLSVEAIASLHPLLVLRYSATHKDFYNLLYRLTPNDAYEADLVKKTGLRAVRPWRDESQAYVLVEDVTATKKTVEARISLLDTKSKGEVGAAPRVHEIHAGDDLEKKTGNPRYAGYVVEEIVNREGEEGVLFKNGEWVGVGEETETDRRAVQAEQIRETIKRHRVMQEQWDNSEPVNARVKVLSLFFIEWQEDYKRLGEIFDAEWEEQVGDGLGEQMREAYFANVGKEDAEQNKEAYDLILREKERLLSFEDDDGSVVPAFIFTHSALKEGWDNPNVFQICLLRMTKSEVERRQQIGRGLRLPVNVHGERRRKNPLNALTLVIDESITEFQKKLLKDYQKAGVSGNSIPPLPEEMMEITRTDLAESEEFIELWNRINYQSRFQIDLNSKKIVAAVAKNKRLAQLANFPPAHFTIESGETKPTKSGSVVSRKTHEASGRAVARRSDLPDLLPLIEKGLLAGASMRPRLRLSRSTLIAILKKLTDVQWQGAVNQPEKWAIKLGDIIRDTIADEAIGLLIDATSYEPLPEGEPQSMDSVFLEKHPAAFASDGSIRTISGGKIQEKKDRFVDATNSRNSLYNWIPIDSPNLEKAAANALMDDTRVKVFVKLENTFTINTPVGENHPDWAVVVKDKTIPGGYLYVVYETKDDKDLAKVTQENKIKIPFAAKHFELTHSGDKPVLYTWGPKWDSSEVISEARKLFGWSDGSTTKQKP